MIPILLLGLFGVTCVAMIVKTMRRRTGLIEFPFLAAAGMLGFLFPQAVGIVLHPETVPYAGLIKALIMCTVCTGAVYWGWAPRKFAGTHTVYSPIRAYWFGVVLLGIGVAAFTKLTALSGGIASHYSTSGSYALDWRGWPVVYVFFMEFLTPGVVLTTLSAVALRNIWRYLPLLPPAAIYIANIVFLGRRGIFIELCVLSLCMAYFARGWTPSRPLVLAVLPFAALAMFLAPYYRTYSQIGADRAMLREIPIADTVRGLAEPSAGEFWTMAFIVEVTDLTGSYELGRGLYNTFVRLFVPKLVVGESSKEDLYWGEPGREYYDNPLGWVIPSTIVPTGPGSAYREFSFLGAIWFYLLARFLRSLFHHAVVSKDMFAQAAYAGSLLMCVSTVVNDMFGVYHFLFVMGPVLITARLLSTVPQNRPRGARRPPRWITGQLATTSMSDTRP